MLVSVINESQQDSVPSELTVHFSSGGETAQMQGPLPALPPGRQLKLPLETPFQCQEEIDPNATSFQASQGQSVHFWATVEAAP